MASDITLAEKKLGKINVKKRVELHLHTKMSSLDGLTNIDSAIKGAAFGVIKPLQLLTMA